MSRLLPARRFALLLLVAATARGQESSPPGLAGNDPEMGSRIQAVLREHGAEIHGCYGGAQAASPRLAGEVLLRLHVLPGGAIERVDVLKDQTGSLRLTGCLAEAMRRWRAPRLAGEATQQIVFPLAFRPDDTPPPPSVGAPGPAAHRYVVPSAAGLPGPLPGGKLEARVLIDEAAVGPTRGSLTLLRLQPSARLALHQHPGALELLYVVRGGVRLRDDSGPAIRSAVAGDLVVAAAGAPHSIEATPLSPLDLVQIFVAAGPERAYKDRAVRGGTVAVPKRRGPPPAKGSPAVGVVAGAAQKSYPIAGGKGSASLLLDGWAGATASLQRFEAAAGAQVPEHRHDESDEILYVIEGRGDMTVAGRLLPVGPGDAIHLPKATPHALRVVEKMVAVQCYAPPGPEQRFKLAPAQRTEPAK